MIVTTGNEVAGKTITEYLGIVRGIVVRAPSLSQRFSGGFKTLSGGNIEEFAEVCDDAREEAYLLMIRRAKKLEADAIIAIRFDATEFAENISEVFVYGTAVKLSS